MIWLLSFRKRATRICSSSLTISFCWNKARYLGRPWYCQSWLPKSSGARSLFLSLNHLLLLIPSTLHPLNKAISALCDILQCFLCRACGKCCAAEGIIPIDTIFPHARASRVVNLRPEGAFLHLTLGSRLDHLGLHSFYFLDSVFVPGLVSLCNAQTVRPISAASLDRLLIDPGSKSSFLHLISNLLIFSLHPL